MADAMETSRQDVHQEAADELVGRQCHAGVAARPFDPVVLVFEGDAGLVNGDQAAIGDGDAMGVARQIGQHRLGSAERTLGIDDPLDPAQRRQIGGEGLVLSELGVIAEELQPAGGVGGGQHLQDQAPE